MAGSTIPRKMVFRFIGIVAGGAGGGCTCKLSIHMTTLALQIGMTASQREESMFCALASRREDHHFWIDCGDGTHIE